MTTPRSASHSATVLPSGRLLIAGGGEGSEIYDPINDRWESAGSLHGVYGNQVAVSWPGGLVLIAGGYGTGSEGSGTAAAELYTEVVGFHDGFEGP